MHLKGGVTDVLLYRATVAISIFGKANIKIFMLAYSFQCANIKILSVRYSLQYALCFLLKLVMQFLQSVL